MTKKKNKSTLSYRDIEDLPEDDWIRNLGPMVIYSTPPTKEKSKKKKSKKTHGNPDLPHPEM